MVISILPHPPTVYLKPLLAPHGVVDPFFQLSAAPVVLAELGQPNSVAASPHVASICWDLLVSSSVAECASISHVLGAGGGGSGKRTERPSENGKV